MATPRLHHRHEKLLLEIIKTEGILGDPFIKYETPPETPDGYVACYDVIEIAGENKSLKLFAKSAPCGRRPIIHNMFAREIHFYEAVLPQFKKFQLDHDVQEVFDAVPKCYACSCEAPKEILMMENLKDQGYTPYSKEGDGDMDDDHILKVFRQYARFHSISYAMKNENPQLYNDLSNNLNDLTGAYFRASGADVVFARLARRAAEEAFTSELHVSTKMGSIEELCGKTLLGVDDFADDYSAITHGDCWFNNLMFKYEGTSLKDVKLVDWQMMRLNSPALDLSHFFYSVANRDALAKLDFYLRTYHEALSGNIREMGGDPSKLYPYWILEEHWRRCSRFGLAMAFGNVRFFFSGREEVSRMLELANTGVPHLEAFTIDIKNQDLYVRRVKDLIQHFVSRGFL